jgi:FAD/FMN-containing dehydrogenase
MEFVTKHIPGTSSPFEFVYAWYVLLEFDFYNTHKEREKIEKLLSTAMEKNIIKNAVIAKTLEQAAKLKNLREHISAAQKPEGASVKHDISVPIDKIPGFIIKASIAVTGLVPSSRPLPFGHVGDGNIHFNVSQPPTMNPAIYLSKRERMTRMVHDIVDEFGGSISAEHGIGIVKKEELAKRADKTKMHSMRQIKQALDPDNLMNPRVLFT